MGGSRGAISAGRRSQRPRRFVAARRWAHCRLMIHRVVNRENPRPNKTAQKAEANTKNPELSPAKMPM